MMSTPKTFAEKEALKAIDRAWGPKAVKAVKRVSKLAARQGGRDMRENYELLGKRALGIAVAATAGVAVGAAVGVLALTRAFAARKASVQHATPAQLPAGASDDAEGDCQQRLQCFERSQPSSFYRAFGKRACDVVVGVLALPFVALAVAGCGIAIRVEDGGPIFYNAPRVGKDGRTFTMYKLRSMKVDAPDLVMEDGSTYNGADDPRMTRVGAFMRKTSLDEMPQFLNVLCGDMSVVGPRPDLAREVELYRGEECLKLAVRPGITGYAAVYGRNALPWHQRLALDVYYVRNLSFPLDLKVFLKTFSTVFNQEGIYVGEPSGPSQSALPEASHSTAKQG